MGIQLRLQPWLPDGSRAEFTVRIVLDPDFYESLNDVVDYIDDLVYTNTGGTFLTAEQDAFDLGPSKYAAIAVVQDA